MYCTPLSCMASLLLKNFQYGTYILNPLRSYSFSSSHCPKLQVTKHLHIYCSASPLYPTAAPAMKAFLILVASVHHRGCWIQVDTVINTIPIVRLGTSSKHIFCILHPCICSDRFARRPDMLDCPSTGLTWGKQQLFFTLQTIQPVQGDSMGLGYIRAPFPGLYGVHRAANGAIGSR